jgi:hypothetical protein
MSRQQLSAQILHKQPAMNCQQQGAWTQPRKKQLDG